MDVVMLLLKVLPHAQGIVEAVNTASITAGEEREAAIVAAATHGLQAAEAITGRDLLNDEAVQHAVREAVEAVVAAKAVIDTRPRAATPGA